MQGCGAVGVPAAKTETPIETYSGLFVPDPREDNVCSE